MMSRLYILAVTLTATLWIAVAAAAEDTESVTQAGAVEQVTLYRGQALVSRTIPIEAARGNIELVVPDLPANVVPESLFAEGAEGLQVRAVRYRTRAVGEAPREEVRKLDEQIEALQAAQQEIAATQQLVAQHMQYLDKLEGFVAPTATAELTKGVLDAEQLQQLTEFTFTRRTEAMKQQLELQQRQQKLSEEMNLLQRQRAELTDGSSKTIREAVVFIDKRVDAAASVTLNYLTGGCGWTPSYNFRAQAEAMVVQAEYNAIVYQRSGEDWNNVELTLSTASPVLSAKGPGLAPFEISLASAVYAGPQTVPNNLPSANQAPNAQPQQQLAPGGYSPGKVAEQVKDIRQQREQAQQGQSTAYGSKANLDNAWQFNRAANEYQVLELIGQADVLRSLQQESPASGEGPSINYQLQNRISMASRDDQQIVQITRAELEGSLYHVATPVLTTYVYREAEVVNTSDEDLLGGPINVYLDGRFVGRGEIGTVARGQTFVLGFGADPQLRARRELVDKDETTQGGNRVLSFDYRLTIENFKQQPLAVRVTDRLPFAERENEIKITLDTGEHKLADDPFYLRRERPRGILRWDVEVPAGAAGEDATVVDYDYTLEFARNLQISSPQGNGDPEEKLQEELHELERFRQYRN